MKMLICCRTCQIAGGSGNPSAKAGFLGLQAKISRNASVYADWTQVLLAIRAALGFRVKKRLSLGANRCRLSHRPCSAGWRFVGHQRLVLDTMPGTVRS